MSDPGLEERSQQVRKFVEHLKSTGDMTEEEREAWEIAKLVQGMVAGSLMQPGIKSFLKTDPDTPIEMPQDEYGNYLDHFILVTASGIRVRVSVRPE